MKVTVTYAGRGPRPAAAAVAVRDWPVWSLPRLARAYVIAVPVAAAIALGVAAGRATWHVSQLGIFFMLLTSAAAMVEAAHRPANLAGMTQQELFGEATRRCERNVARRWRAPSG